MPFDDDADDSREKAKQGRRNNDFRDFFDSVKYEINETAKYGGNSTTYPVSEDNQEFKDIVIDRLTEGGYEVSYDAKKERLNISWPEPENES